MTEHHDDDARVSDPVEVTRDTSAHRKLFTYLTADAADDYIAIMRLFTGTLLNDLSASDVAAQLAGRGIPLDPDVAEDRCQQLVLWGNLVRSVRETRVPTVAAYHRSRSRFQVSKLGGRLHREAEEILRAVDGVQEVARELLARIATWSRQAFRSGTTVTSTGPAWPSLAE